MKYAIIDIGSNSVRLMLWADGKSLYKRVETTRLGEGLAHSGRISEAAIERSARAVANFAEEGRRAGAAVHAFATAAVRRSSNGAEFYARVFALCGVKVDVVSGLDEARLGLAGACGTSDGGIVDIGGASTEIGLQKGGKSEYSISLDIGAVRLFDRCKDCREALLPVIKEAILPLSNVKPLGKMYAIGGTASTLASLKLGLPAYDAAKIQDLPLEAGEIAALADKLLSLRAEERKRLAGMDVPRADIIAGGALLLAQIMKKMSLSVIYASDRDNLEGYLTLRGLA